MKRVLINHWLLIYVLIMLFFSAILKDDKDDDNLTLESKAHTSSYIIHHSFADDLQLQMSAPPDRISELLHSIQSCISDVKVWATANMLKLNDSKTELMLVTSKRSKHLHNLPFLSL